MAFLRWAAQVTKTFQFRILKQKWQKRQFFKIASLFLKQTIIRYRLKLFSIFDLIWIRETIFVEWAIIIQKQVLYNNEPSTFSLFIKWTIIFKTVAAVVDWVNLGLRPPCLFSFPSKAKAHFPPLIILNTLIDNVWPFLFCTHRIFSLVDLSPTTFGQRPVLDFSK